MTAKLGASWKNKQPPFLQNKKFWQTLKEKEPFIKTYLSGRGGVGFWSCKKYPKQNHLYPPPPPPAKSFDSPPQCARGGGGIPPLSSCIWNIYRLFLDKHGNKLRIFSHLTYKYKLSPSSKRKGILYIIPFVHSL